MGDNDTIFNSNLNNDHKTKIPFIQNYHNSNLIFFVHDQGFF